MRYLFALVCVFVSSIAHTQVVMESPFVPAYIFDFAYTAGCASDACFPTVFAGLDENADPIYVEHVVEFDFNDLVGSGSLVLGSQGKLTTVSGPIRQDIENVFAAIGVDLNLDYAGVATAPFDGLEYDALDEGTCLIKPEIVFEDYEILVCLNAASAIHGRVSAFSVSSPDCTAPDGFIEFAFDNSQFSAPQVTFEWTNGASPDPACDEDDVQAEIDGLYGTGSAMEDGCPMFLPPCTEDELRSLQDELMVLSLEGDCSSDGIGRICKGDPEKDRRTSETMATWFDQPAYTVTGSLITDDYEDDGDADGETPDPSPPLGGYDPRDDEAGEGGNDIVDYCADNPDGIICEQADDEILDAASSTSSDFLGAINNRLDGADGVLDIVAGFALGDGVSIGSPVTVCPLPESIPLLMVSGDLDTSAWCDIWGGPVRFVIQLSGIFVSAFVLIRGVARA